MVFAAKELNFTLFFNVVVHIVSLQILGHFLRFYPDSN